jgi:hypothetical protein
MKQHANITKYGYPQQAAICPTVSPEMVDFLNKTWDDYEGNDQAIG